jgi:hypothetical protein
VLQIGIDGRVTETKSRTREGPPTDLETAQVLTFDTLRNFDNLPDDAVVSDKIAAVLLGISERNLRGKNPVPYRKITEGRHGRRVGDIRALVRGTATATTGGESSQPPPVSDDVDDVGHAAAVLKNSLGDLANAKAIAEGYRKIWILLLTTNLSHTASGQAEMCV